MTDDEAVAAAVVALLEELAADPFDYDTLPTSRPARYTEVTVSRRYGELSRSETPTVTLWRVTTRAVAKTVSNARELRRRAGLIEGQVLVVAGVESTPVQFETADPIAPDEAWYSGLATWTFAL